MIVDISQVSRGGVVTEIAEGNWNDRFPGTNLANYPFGNSPAGDGCGPYDCNLFVHSMGVKPDGSLTYLALEAGHFLVLDTRQVAAGMPNPQLVLLTDPAPLRGSCGVRPDSAVNRPCVGLGSALRLSHSAVEHSGRQLTHFHSGETAYQTPPYYGTTGRYT